jgi:hypothetical protein
MAKTSLQNQITYIKELIDKEMTWLSMVSGEDIQPESIVKVEAEIETLEVIRKSLVKLQETRTMGELLKALINTATPDYTIGFKCSGYDQYTISLFHWESGRNTEQVLPENHLDRLPQVLGFMRTTLKDKEVSNG